MEHPSVKSACAAVSMLEQRGHKKLCTHTHMYIFSVRLSLTFLINTNSVNGAGTNGHPYGGTKSLRPLVYT